MSDAGVQARFGSGHTVRRIEDPALVRGEGRYTDDVVPEGQLQLVFLRSPHAHARIVSVDAEAARGMPGVLAVYTGADLLAQGVKPMPSAVPFPRPDGSPGATAVRHAIAVDRVRHVGEAVAAVVARTKREALDASEAILVDFDPLPAVTDIVAATAPGAPALCDGAPDNIAAEKSHGDAAATDAAFARAAHVVRVEVANQRLAPSAMEPRVVLAQPQGDRLVIRLSSQMPTSVRDGVAATLGLGKEQVRVLVGDVGGGFGMKTGLYPEDVVVAHAARALGAPVKWVSTRLEEFQCSVHGRDQTSRGEMALDADGRVLALRVRTVANVGAHALTPGVAIPLLIGPWVTTSVYDIPTVYLKLTAVMSNCTPIAAYRGAGRPEAIFLTERLMDAAARELKLDPAELRRRNLIRPEQFPYRNPMGQVYDVGAFEKMLDQGLELADWSGYAQRVAESTARGRLRGRSVATFLEWTGGNALTENVTVHVLPEEGVIELVSATMAMGQGIATSYAQLAVDAFGVPIEKIRIRQGDTDAANGFGSAGSRSLFTGGSAVKVASDNTIARAKQLAGEALEAAPQDIEYAAGRFTIAGTDRGIGLFELAAKQSGARISVSGSATAGAPSWPNACHVCEVEVDPETGEVAIVAYASVNDIGRVVSPQIVQGQIEGGAVQGIGQALCERVTYDADSGQLLTASFMDYAIPHADVFRGFRTVFDTSVPCTTNTLGVKGVGELGTIGATPAVVNAVVDALAAAGLGREAERLQMPLTAPTVWRALHERAFDEVRLF